MPKIKETEKGLAHIHTVLKNKVNTITRAALWKIPHRTAKDDIRLKVGRCKKIRIEGLADEILERPENEIPKSELTLDYDELKSLISFLEDNYEPLRIGEKNYIPLGEEFDPSKIEHLKALFDNPNKELLVDFIVENNVLPDDLLMIIEYKNRLEAINGFETMLDEDLLEDAWQKWFERNSWVLGSDFVRIVDERHIDTQNISDYLMEAYDGFLDIVEIKRPSADLRFWAEARDHDNYIPSQDLTKAIIQTTRYIHAVEQEADSIKFTERVGSIRVIKPRGLLVFGRSEGWNKEQNESYRILNSSFHNVTILTYDHVFARAKRIIEAKTRDKDDGKK